MNTECDFAEKGIAMSDNIDWSSVGRFTEEEIAEGMIEGRICLNCGKQVLQSGSGRPRRFCCVECRVEYWNTHRDVKRRASCEKMMCPICGRIFYDDKAHHRRYCSISCSNRGRRL